MRLTTDAARRPEPTERYRRMEFLEQFMNALGITYRDMAEIVGIAPPAVSHIFFSNCDDTKLSYCFKVIEHYDYTLDITMTRSTEESSGQKIVNLEDYIIVPDGAVVQPARLTFITLALKRYGISKSDLAAKMSLQYASVRNIFLRDDITISRLYQIADVCRFDLRFSIHPRRLQQDGDQRKHRVISDLHVISSSEF